MRRKAGALAMLVMTMAGGCGFVFPIGDLGFVAADGGQDALGPFHDGSEIGEAGPRDAAGFDEPDATPPDCRWAFLSAASASGVAVKGDEICRNEATTFSGHDAGAFRALLFSKLGQPIIELPNGASWCRPNRAEILSTPELLRTGDDVDLCVGADGGEVPKQRLVWRGTRFGTITITCENWSPLTGANSGEVVFCSGGPGATQQGGRNCLSEPQRFFCVEAGR